MDGSSLRCIALEFGLQARELKRNVQGACLVRLNMMKAPKNIEEPHGVLRGCSIPFASSVICSSPAVRQYHACYSLFMPSSMPP